MPVAKRKSCHSRPARNTYVGCNSCFVHLSRSKTFGRARRKKFFGRHSFLHRSRQSLKFSVKPGAKTFWSASFLHHSRQLQKCFAAPGAEKIRLAYIFASVAPVVKTFGRAMRENTSVGSLLCFGLLSCKNMRLAGS